MAVQPYPTNSRPGRHRLHHTDHVNRRCRPSDHHPNFSGKSGGGLYSDTLAELDFRTGQVLDAIDQALGGHHRRVDQRQPNGTITGDGRLQRAVARSLRVRFRGRVRPGMVRWPCRMRGLPTRSSPPSTGCRRWRRWSGRVSGSLTTGRLTASTPRRSFGQSSATGRDHVICYGSDGAPMLVKWITMKVVFRYAESTSGPIV